LVDCPTSVGFRGSQPLSLAERAGASTRLNSPNWAHRLTKDRPGPLPFTAGRPSRSQPVTSEIRDLGSGGAICQIAGLDDAEAFCRRQADRWMSGPCSARHSAITRHLHFTTGARRPELLARRLCCLRSVTPGAAQLLARMIEAKLAFLISGGTGSGKTTLRLRRS
jgi:hypothetical protein